MDIQVTDFETNYCIWHGFQLSRSVGQIIRFSKECPFNAFVLSNICEYCHQSNIAKKYIL